MLATAITVFRLFLLVVFVGLMLQGWFMPAAAVFFVAWALDAVDGWVARAYHEESEAGSFLDKFTDRLLIGSACLLLLSQGLVPWWGVFIITKDLLLLPVPWVHDRRREPMKAAGIVGKATTLLQGVAIVWLMVGGKWPEVIVGVTALAGLYVAATHWVGLMKSSHKLIS